MKWLRRLLLLVAVFAILNSVTEVLCYLVPSALGILGMPAIEATKLGLALLTLVFGTGLLWLKNWARLGMIGLTLFRALSLGLVFLFMQRKAIEALGYIILGCIMAGFALYIVFLIAASRVTRGEVEPVGRGWRIAGLVAALAGVGVCALSFIDLSTERLEDLPITEQSVPAELAEASRWQLERIPNTALLDGSLRANGPTERSLSLVPQDGLVTITGIPELSKFRVRFDPSRCALVINEMVFVGELFDTKRFLWRDLPAKGVRFTNEASPVKGTITFGTVADGSMYILLKLDMYFRDVEALYRARRVVSDGSGMVAGR